MTWTIETGGEQPVLLPFDFSEPATAAITTARGLIERSEQLFVLHVITPISMSSPGALAGGLDIDSLRAHADTELAKVLSVAGVGEAQRRIRIGDPASEILDLAQEIDAKLIVIPSHGKTGLRRWMIGSVAERVVRRTRHPVLVLPILDDDD